MSWSAYRVVSTRHYIGHAVIPYAGFGRMCWDGPVIEIDMRNTTWTWQPRINGTTKRELLPKWVFVV